MKAKLIVALVIVLTMTLYSFCFAQTDSSIFHQRNFPSKTTLTLSSLQLQPYTKHNYAMSKSLLYPNYIDTFFHKSIYYDPFYKCDFSYTFDPSNPWETNDPFEAILNGSINYLLEEIYKRNHKK